MKLILLFSDKIITQFMQHADVFEKFKVLIQKPVIVDVIDDFGASNIEAMNAVCAADGKFDLVACIGREKVYFTNPAVKVVSTGKEWAIIEDYIAFIQRDFMLINDRESLWHIGAVT